MMKVERTKDGERRNLHSMTRHGPVDHLQVGRLALSSIWSKVPSLHSEDGIVQSHSIRFDVIP